MTITQLTAESFTYNRVYKVGKENVTNIRKAMGGYLIKHKNGSSTLLEGNFCFETIMDGDNQ